MTATADVATIEGTSAQVADCAPVAGASGELICEAGALVAQQSPDAACQPAREPQHPCSSSVRDAAAAHAYVETGRKRGSVVLSVAHAG